MYVHCTFQWNGTLYMKCVYYILLECVTWSIGFDQILPKHNLWQYVDAEWHKWPSVGVMLCKTYVCLFLSIFIFSLFFYANDVDYLYEEPMENVHLKPQASQLETYGKKCINVASCLNIACIAFLSQALSQRNARLYTIYFRAEAYIKSGNYRLAFNDAKKCFDSDNDNVKVWFVGIFVCHLAMNLNRSS